MVPHQRTTLSYRRRPVSRGAPGPSLAHGTNPWAERPRDNRIGGAIIMTARFFAVGLLLASLTAGCADSGAASDNDKRPVFYGGVSSGVSRP